MLAKTVWEAQAALNLHGNGVQAPVSGLSLARSRGAVDGHRGGRGRCSGCCRSKGWR